MASFVLCKRTLLNEAYCSCCLERREAENRHMRELNELAEITRDAQERLALAEKVVEAAERLRNSNSESNYIYADELDLALKAYNEHKEKPRT